MDTTAAYVQVSALIAPYIVTQPLVVVTSYSQSADSPLQLMHIQWYPKECRGLFTITLILHKSLEFTCLRTGVVEATNLVSQW